MGHYSVLIITMPANSPRRITHIWKTVYFGEDETMMQVKFYEAVRMAQNMPTAVSVVVWHDLEELVRVRIEH